jgi:hypothetical protein
VKAKSFEEPRSSTISGWYTKVLKRGQQSKGAQLIQFGCRVRQQQPVDRRLNKTSLEVLEDAVEAGPRVGDMAAQARGGVASTFFDLDGEPRMVLPMRLNEDALSDLVVLRSGRSMVTVLMTQTQSAFTVTNTNDSGSGSLGKFSRRQSESGADTIGFNIPGQGPQAIRMCSAHYNRFGDYRRHDATGLWWQTHNRTQRRVITSRNNRVWSENRDQQLRH